MNLDLALVAVLVAVTLVALLAVLCIVGAMFPLGVNDDC